MGKIINIKNSEAEELVQRFVDVCLLIDETEQEIQFRILKEDMLTYVSNKERQLVAAS